MTDSDRPSFRDVLRLGFVFASWLAAFQLLAHHGAELLPLSIARHLTLESYLAIVHLLTLGFGLAVALLLLRAPRRELALTTPSATAVGLTLLLAPALFVASTYTAFMIARPTLLEELMRGGRELVQKSSGDFGRAITESSVLLALLWAVIVTPVSEELLFRGAGWSFVQRTVERLTPARPNDAPSSLALPMAESTGLRLLGGARHWFVSGGIATLVTTLVFAALHADMQGGLGIVRVASAAGLGLGCALARQHTASIAAPIALHVVYNALSLGTTRRWLISESFPVYRTVPSVLFWVGGACLLCALALIVTRRLRRA